MQDSQSLAKKTIQDFGEQWSKFSNNEGWYASFELFTDILSPLIEPADLQGMTVAEIGSGTGRIVRMILETGARYIYAVEPATQAFRVLERNVQDMPSDLNAQMRVTLMLLPGDQFVAPEPLDFVFSIGVIHHIPDPLPVLLAIHQSLKPGGKIFLWLYGYEGNETYLSFINPLRKITTLLPHTGLVLMTNILYWLLRAYMALCILLPLPLRDYLKHVFQDMSPSKKRLIIYDQLNPAYAKYYRRDEALELLEKAGFENIQFHHRHGYSWSVLGSKPE